MQLLLLYLLLAVALYVPQLIVFCYVFYYLLQSVSVAAFEILIFLLNGMDFQGFCSVLSSCVDALLGVYACGSS